jgi:cobalt/nickel transport system ATP-binding protein
MLIFERVSYRCDGSSVPALQHVSVTIPTGQRVAILGRNGTGKRTVRLVGAGLLRPQQGQVRLGDRPIDYSRTGLRHLRHHVGLVMQSPDEQRFRASVWHGISVGPLHLG